MAHLWVLQARVLPRGYFPDTTKSILFLDLRVVARAEDFFRRMGLPVLTVIWYLEGFKSDGATEKIFLAGKVEGWAESVGNLAGISCKHLHSDYDGLQKSLQKEWAFVQWVTSSIGYAFGPVEKLLWETFLTALFEG